jgi:hypothetical protein
MGRRTFCDHCGNTISNDQPKAYCFGKYPTYHSQSSQHPLGALIAAGGGGGGGSYTGMQSGYDVSTLVRVELCPVCEPIWLERVKRLCNPPTETKE